MFQHEQQEAASVVRPAQVQETTGPGWRDGPAVPEAGALARPVMPVTAVSRGSTAGAVSVQRKALPAFIQRKASGGLSTEEGVSQQIEDTRGRGNTLDAPVKSFMESRFDADFSSVKIHTDSAAVGLNRDLQAHAFTVGNDIYFNEGKYEPGTHAGKHLLAHELTHTLQQATTATPAIQKQHGPGGPYHAPEGTDLRCTSSDTCAQLSLKINYLRHMIRSHQEWDVINPDPNYPGGRHAQEILELSNALANCIAHTVRCRNQPQIIPVPAVDPAAARRVALATAIGGGVGMVAGALIGGLGGAGGGTLVAPGVGTVGGGIAGGASGAAYGAAVGGLAGGAIMGGAQALYEWLSD